MEKKNSFWLLDSGLLWTENYSEMEGIIEE